MVLLSKKTSRNYWEMSRRSQFERLKSCSVENIFSILHLIINYHNGLNLLSRYIQKHSSMNFLEQRINVCQNKYRLG